MVIEEDSDSGEEGDEGKDVAGGALKEHFEFCASFPTVGQ